MCVYERQPIRDWSIIKSPSNESIPMQKQFTFFSLLTPAWAFGEWQLLQRMRTPPPPTLRKHGRGPKNQAKQRFNAHPCLDKAVLGCDTHDGKRT